MSRVQVNIRVDAQLRDRVDSYLRRTGRTRRGDRSIFLEGLILEGLNRREASEKRRKPR